MSGKSLAQEIAELEESEREAALAGVEPDALLWDWSFWSRPEQRAPGDEDWGLWLFLAGRGAGKTRSAAEWVREKVREEGPAWQARGGLRLGLMARTAADVRDVIVEGESGIMAVSPPGERPEWSPSKRRLTWANGAQALCMTGDEPDQARGPQFHYSWVDELASHRQLPDQMGVTGFENVRIATRLGERPKIIVTTTPKKVKVIRDLVKESGDGRGRTRITRGTTMDNAGNLSGAYLEGLVGIYGGTRVARQELWGELLDDVEGALWTEEMIEEGRVAAAPAGLPLRVVGVDPTVAERPGDACGIVVCLGTADRELYRRECWVVDDLTVMGSPEVWASRVVRASRRWGAPVVAEVNQGGALVRAAIQSVDPGVRVLEVRSRVGKALRAEPVALAYEQGRVHHLGVLSDLESEMTTWEPGNSGRSPDRLDAVVHALTALLVSPPGGLVGGGLTGSVPGKGIRVPMGRVHRDEETEWGRAVASGGLARKILAEGGGVRVRDRSDRPCAGCSVRGPCWPRPGARRPWPRAGRRSRGSDWSPSSRRARVPPPARRAGGTRTASSRRSSSGTGG
jgi:phage terminase large subunit-like protein